MGNFTVDIRKKASMVDWTKCIGCEICVQKCPAKAPDSFNVGLEPTKAIYIPFPQAVPKRAAIQVDYCRYFQTGKCKVCERVCPADAIDYEQKDEIVQQGVRRHRGGHRPGGLPLGGVLRRVRLAARSRTSSPACSTSGC